MKYKVRLFFMILVIGIVMAYSLTAYANPEETVLPEDAAATRGLTEQMEEPPATEGPVTEMPDTPEESIPEPPIEPVINDPVVDTVPTKLRIHLGVHWAKTEFELVTAEGPYPDPVVVDEYGDINIDIPEGTDVTIRVINRAVIPPVPSSEVSEQETSPTDDPLTPAGTESLGELDEEVDDGIQIPMLHIVLFIGGSVLCIGFLIFFFVRKRRRYEYYDDEEYEEREGDE